MLEMQISVGEMSLLCCLISLVETDSCDFCESFHEDPDCLPWFIMSNFPWIRRTKWNECTLYTLCHMSLWVKALDLVTFTWVYLFYVWNCCIWSHVRGVVAFSILLARNMKERVGQEEEAIIWIPCFTGHLHQLVSLEMSSKFAKSAWDFNALRKYQLKPAGHDT